MNKINYTCQKCGADGVRLWREYQAFADHTELLCAFCACEREGKDSENFLADMWHGQGDQIGWMVPAVMTDDRESFWGYTSVPQAAVNAWYRMPLTHSPHEHDGRHPVEAALGDFYEVAKEGGVAATAAFLDYLGAIVRHKESASLRSNVNRALAVLQYSSNPRRLTTLETLERIAWAVIGEGVTP